MLRERLGRRYDSDETKNARTHEFTDAAQSASVNLELETPNAPSRAQPDEFGRLNRADSIYSTIVPTDTHGAGSEAGYPVYISRHSHHRCYRIFRGFIRTTPISLAGAVAGIVARIVAETTTEGDRAD